MKITNRLWDDWLRQPALHPVYAESEMAGIVGSMDFSSTNFNKVRSEEQKSNSIRLTCDRIWVFRRVRKIWPVTKWAKQTNLAEILSVKKTGRGRVDLLIPSYLYHSILKKTEEDEFVRWPWMRGVFGVSGAIYNPSRGYYCILRIKSPLVASEIKDLFDNNGVHSSMRIKNKIYELTVRDKSQIIQLCDFMGLQETSSALNEKVMVRYLRDQANKLVNCDSANIEKTLESARRQVKLCNFIIKNAIDISPTLQALVDLRLENPSATFQELGETLFPPVSKSTIRYRFEKLKQIARENGYIDDN